MIDFDKLSLREKVGQMIIGGFQGAKPSKEILELIQDYHIGGVIYFSRNIQDVEQLFHLSKELQSHATQHNKLPLFISIDQEGGVVSRIINGITLMPGNMALGATRNVEGVFQAAKITGSELRALGINMNFAPCVDLFNNPLNPVIGVRSYGENPEMVGEMGIAAVKGLQEAGIAATIKHFPGHGDTDIDSHLDLPTIPHDLERLYQTELIPFKKAIEHRVDAIMTAHIVFPHLEESIPTTLSQKSITQLLRSELNYDGVVITDCLEMKAIASYYGTDEAAVMAVEAGVDLLLFSHRMDRQIGAIEAIVTAVEQGRLTEDRINQSLHRIVSLKQERNMGYMIKAWQEAKQFLGIPNSLHLARSLSEQSITLLKNEHQRLPIRSDLSTLVIWPEISVTTEVDEIFPQKDSLGEKLSFLDPHVVERRMETNPTPADIAKVLEESEGYKQIVVASYNASSNPGQVELISRLVELEQKGTSVIVVAVRNPTDILHFPQVKTYLASYESRSLALESVANVLLGKIGANGKLPITLLPHPK